MAEPASKHGQWQNVLDQLRALNKKAEIQLYYIGYYEEPAREEVKKLAEDLSAVGKLLVEICDKESVSESSHSNGNDQNHQIQNENPNTGQQQQDIQLKNLFKDVYSEIIKTIKIYIQSALIYGGTMPNVWHEMITYRLGDYQDPTKCCFPNWIDSRTASGHCDIENEPTLVSMLRDLRNMGADLESCGIKMTQSLDSSQYILQLASPSFYNKWFFIFQCISLGFYTFDVGSDVALAIAYLSTGKILNFGLTACCVVIPSIIISYIAYLWSTKTGTQWDIFGFLESAVPNYNPADDSQENQNIVGNNGWPDRIHSAVNVVISVLFRYIELIRYSYISLSFIARVQSIKTSATRAPEANQHNINSEEIMTENKDIFIRHFSVAPKILEKECEMSFLSFLEGFMEAAPQLILQLTILKMEGFNSSCDVTTDVIRYFSVLTSLMSLAWIPVSLYRTMRMCMFYKTNSLNRYKEMKEGIKSCYGYFDAGFVCGDAALYLGHFFGIVSRMIVLSQFVYSVYVLPVFIVCHCVGLPLWQFIKKRDSYQNLWQELFGKMAITYAWLGFVNIFNFVGFTLSKTSSSGELKLTFPLKNMFINYKYSAVCFAENTFFLVLYVLNAYGYFGNHYNPSYNPIYHHTLFFAISQPLFFLISLILLRIHSQFYSEKYQRWLKKESHLDEWNFCVKL